MIKVHVGGSFSKLIDAPKHNFIAIAKILSYLDQGLFYSTKNRFISTKYLIDKEGNFPTGLVDRVVKYLIEDSIPYELVDSRIRPAAGTLGLIQRKDEPVAYMEQQQAVELCAADHEGRGICVMPTGVGKSRTLKDLILNLQVPTLVVPPSSNLKNQLYKYLKECYGSKYVGLYSKHSGCQKPITIANIDGLENGQKHHFKDTQCVIIDEFHHSAAATYRTINENLWSDIYYKFGFTATNYRNNPADQILLESVLSRELFTMTPIEAIQKGYIVPIQTFMYHIQNNGLEDTSNYSSCYKKFVVDNVERNRKIIEIGNRMIGQKVPTLILVKQIPHGRLLQECIPGAVFVNGQDENSSYNMDMVEKFNNLEVPCLIGTSVIGEGVDTKAAGAVILASGEKAESRICQNIGRVVRNYPNKHVGYVFDFWDHGSKYMTRHSEARKRIYENTFGGQVHLLH
jgi:superfamily II DNA or RNA helicase